MQEENKTLMYISLGVGIATILILMWQVKTYHDIALTYQTLYQTCSNSTTLDWGNFVQ